MDEGTPSIMLIVCVCVGVCGLCIYAPILQFFETISKLVVFSVGCHRGDGRNGDSADVSWQQGRVDKQLVRGRSAADDVSLAV